MGPIVFSCIPLVGPLTGSVLLVKGGLCGWKMRNVNDYVRIIRIYVSYYS